jgi:hypothetical protein
MSSASCELQHAQIWIQDFDINKFEMNIVFIKSARVM